jgi:AcrR family transcriptional regulator
LPAIRRPRRFRTRILASMGARMCSLARPAGFHHTRAMKRSTKAAPAQLEPKPRADTRQVRDRILDAAESLFAERGFYGASVRDITSAAEVGIAAVNYYFNSKEELFRDVVMRRASVLNEARLRLLGELPASRSSQVARISAIVTAYIAPFLAEGARDPGYRAYFALLAQVSSSTLPALALLAEHFNAVADRFVAAIAAVYPDAPHHACLQAYDYMMGSTLYAFSGNKRLESLARGTARPQLYETEGKELVAYMAGGVARMLAAAAEG